MQNLQTFVNTLNSDDKYSFLNRVNFNGINSDALVKEIKNFFQSFLCIFRIDIKF